MCNQIYLEAQLNCPCFYFEIFSWKNRVKHKRKKKSHFPSTLSWKGAYWRRERSPPLQMELLLTVWYVHEFCSSLNFASAYRKKLILESQTIRDLRNNPRQPWLCIWAKHLWTMSPLCNIQNKLFFSIGHASPVGPLQWGPPYPSHLWANIIYCGWCVIRSWFGTSFWCCLWDLIHMPLETLWLPGPLYANHPCGTSSICFVASHPHSHSMTWGRSPWLDLNASWSHFGAQK